MQAVLDYEVLDYMSFGTTTLDRVVKLSDGKFVTFLGQENKVFSLSGSTVNFEQTINQPISQGYRFVIPAGVDTFYAVSRYNKVDFFTYNQTSGLSLSDSFDCDDDVNGRLICTYAQFINGFLLLGSGLFYEDVEQNYCLSIFDFHNPHYPALLSRIYTSGHNSWRGVFYRDGFYYYIGAEGNVFYSQEITTNPTPMAAPGLDNVIIKACKEINGDFYVVLADSIGQTYLSKLNPSGSSGMIVAWSQEISIYDYYDFPEISGGYIYITGYAGSQAWRINKYQNSATDSLHLVDTGTYPGLFSYKLFQLTNGFFAAGPYQSFLLNNELDQTSIFNQSVVYYPAGIYLNRYLLVEELGGASGSFTRYRIYDLETGLFLNYQNTGDCDGSVTRYGDNKVVFVSNSIDIIELIQNGGYQVVSLPNTHGVNIVDVYEDKLALCGYYNEQWRVGLYRIMNSEAVFLSESPINHICSGIFFYDSSHFVVYRSLGGDGWNNYFYKIESDNSITFLIQIESESTLNLVQGEKIIQTHNNGMVINISNPDSPFVMGQIILPVEGTSCPTYDGIGYFLCKDIFYSYVLDAQLEYVDCIPGTNLKFYDSARIVIPNPCGVILVRIDELVTNQDEYSLQVSQPMLSVYPNPSSHILNLSFSLPTKSDVRLAIYNLKGQKIKTLVSSCLSAGKQQAVWDGADYNNMKVGSGVYFAKLEFAGNTVTQKVMLQR